MQNRSAVETLGFRLQALGNYRTDLTDQTEKIGLIGLICPMADLTAAGINL